MRTLLSSFLAFCALFVLPGHALAQQVYGDEWIDYTKTYLKIPVAQNGVVRLSGATLQASGVPVTATGAGFRLYRQGVEVPLRVSTGSAFGANDFLEFAGLKNDGSADSALYGSAALQTDPGKSLFTDTAAYFLTWDAGAANARFADATNPVPSTPAATVAAVWAKARQSFNGYFAEGKSNEMNYNFPSAQFEEGEGFIHGKYSPGWGFTYQLATPGAVSGQGDARFTTGVVGYSLNYRTSTTVIAANAHPIQIVANGQLMVDTTYGAQQYRRFTRTLSGAALGSSVSVAYNTGVISAANYDYWGVSFVELEYPRNLNFSGSSMAEFKLPASATQQLLSLQGLSGNAGDIYLYDLSGNAYYRGTTGQNGNVDFYVNAAATERRFMVTTPAGIQNGMVEKTVQFKDYSQAGNAGNYVIISHPSLEGPQQAITAYKNYRSSAAGGSYQTMVAYAPDLYDQFAGGVSQSPLAIKRFLARLQASAPVKPEQVLLLGHGVNYAKYRTGSARAYAAGLVPTYGHPGSDALYRSTGNNGLPAIGRISAMNAGEVETCLNKVRDFEQARPQPAVPTYTSESWKKRVLHIAGSSSPSAQAGLIYTLNNASTIIQDSAYGGDVHLIAKNTTNPVDPFTNTYVDSAINAGMSILTFHGHAYSGGFDYNINTPEQYTNRPKLPLFLALGCDVAEIFDTGARTISERYVLTPNGGAINMLAADLIQFDNFHPIYLNGLYSAFSKARYGQTIGQQISGTNDSVLRLNNYAFFRTNLESMILQGDPAVRLPLKSLPDFYVGAEGVVTSPAQITAALDSFQMRIVSYNLGKAFRDTGLVVRLSHTNPAGTTRVVKEYPLRALLNTDTTVLWVPVNRLEDVGLNRFTITIDPYNRIPEMAENNNSYTLDLFISGRQLKPVYPEDYGIVSTPSVTLKASTLNPFAGFATYRMELDTTQLFNSPAKQSFTASGIGGVVKWTPSGSFTDSTVYYWRAAYDSAATATHDWMGSSFIYLPGVGPGWNQSHYYQYLPNDYSGLNYGTDRNFRFGRQELRVKAFVKVMFSDNDVDNNRVQINELDRQRSSCAQYNTTIQVMVIDSATGRLMENTSAVVGQWGSVARCNNLNRGIWVMEFPLNDSGSRHRARRFIEGIPAGKYVLLKSSIFSPLYNPAPVSTWMNDTAGHGAGVSLYHTLKNNLGFNAIDSFTGKRAFLCWTQKGHTVPYFQQVGSTDTTRIEQEFRIQPFDTSGTMKSIVVGPASEWKTLHWRTQAADTGMRFDRDTVSVYARTISGADTLLLRTAINDTSLAMIPATTYPYLQLQWQSRDTVLRTAAQLSYWRVHYTPLPELALNPAAYFSMTDTVQSGNELRFKVALENVSSEPMTPVLVKYRTEAENEVQQELQSVRYRALPAGDTLHATLNFASTAFTGSRYLFIEANPDNDQPEQYHPNNLGYVPFFVIGDVLNPLLDVTFDDIHIRDREVVRQTPLIKIRLTGQNRFRRLADTSLLDVYLRTPDDPITLSRGRRIPYDSTIMRFVPAGADTTGAVPNEAYILYQPKLTIFSTSPDDNLYELIVMAHDPAGTPTSPEGYRVSFRVVEKAGISQLYNYPNPFRNSTRFAYQVTGNSAPKSLSIVIVDVQGRIVKHIPATALDRPHIGQNYTEYAWDGRDDGGNPLSAGMYFYKALFEYENAALPHLPTEVDDFMKKGWGKMVILP